ncbi:Peptidylglycine alpha-hydroxylating monooxygenase [Meloidogyne graminicola]|uniref:peptidylglycine monooxygenase n=1 Tax=Meloidogyne graminicola TaxID=189291 RepID=A0A8S9ZL58_9BILA|nr:Peptidylglycine alpha-hydroxylating monooxygenase [Meloidogyne graminicola]
MVVWLCRKMNIFGKKSKKGTGTNISKIGSVQVFKVPLAQAVKNNPSFDGVPLPVLVRECLDYINFYGLDLEGIFRVSSPKSRLDELESLSNSEKREQIVFQDAHEAAGLLKRFLHHLPENMPPNHILTEQLKPEFERIANVNEQIEIATKTIALFDVVDFKPYVKPRTIEELRQGMPATSKEIEDEIIKQQNLLEYLHEHIQQMRQHSSQQILLKQKEDEMWAVQTGITVLKRRLKSLTDVVCTPVCSKEKEDANKEILNSDQKFDEIELDETNANLLEKQLIASKNSLSNEIGDEKKEIVRLLSVLREILQLRANLPEGEQNQLTESQRATNSLSQQRPSNFIHPRRVINSIDNREQRNVEKEVDNINWVQLCAEEEKRNRELLAELIRYRYKMFVSSIILLFLFLTNYSFGWFHFGNDNIYNKQKLQKLPEGSTDLRMPDVRIETNDTYLCTAFPLDVEEEHYIVSFEPLANKHQIHHMLLFGCEMPGSDEPAWDCGEMSSSSIAYSRSPVCASQPDIIYAWAKGAPTLNLPKGVGFRVGGEAKSKFLVLQVHYMHKMDGEDNSGVRVIHTEDPQPRIAGTLLLATDGRMAPKKTEQLEVACVVDEDVELHPFAFRVHTHRHGTDVRGWLVQENPFNGEDKWTLIGKRNPQLPQLFQPVVNQSIIITQGDILAARCIINNNEKRIIKIGATGEDEMCNFYLMYWTENGQGLKENTCFSAGPPNYKWSNGAGLNHLPKK